MADAGLPSLIDELVPTFAASAEAEVDDAAVPVLGAEQVLVNGAVLSRRREFATTRECARRALALIGVPPEPILKGPRGEPLWPAGTVGSLTHCAGYRAAVVARATDARTIGIDAEPDAPLPEGVLDVVAAGGERAHVHELVASSPGVWWDRLLFSAKETTYKAWYPVMRSWLGFEDVRVEIDPEHGAFTVTVLAKDVDVGECGTRWEGRWLARRGLLLTAVVAARREAVQGLGLPRSVGSRRAGAPCP